MIKFQDACIKVAKKTLKVGDIRKHSDNGNLYKVLKIFTHEVKVQYLGKAYASTWSACYPALDELIERE